MLVRPVCAECAVEMHCSKNDRKYQTRPGHVDTRIWAGDEYTCPQCQARIIIGWGTKPVAWGDGVDVYLNEPGLVREVL